MLDETDPMEPELSALLDLSLAEDLTGEQRDGFLGAVDDELGAVTGSIVPMDRRQFTITSRRTTIPISVRTTWPEPLKVKVRLTSPKLSFPEGDQIITVTSDSPPFRVPVEAKSNGTFRVTAALLDARGGCAAGGADAPHGAIDGAVRARAPRDHRRRRRAGRVVDPAPAGQAAPAGSGGVRRAPPHGPFTERA